MSTDLPVTAPTARTADVLTDVVIERHRQIRLWGHNTDTPNGTGPDVGWIPPFALIGTATEIERSFRADYDLHRREHGTAGLTWMHFLREEFAEAMCEDDPDKLYTELIQVAAVAVSWCEKLRA